MQAGDLDLATVLLHLLVQHQHLAEPGTGENVQLGTIDDDTLHPAIDRLLNHLGDLFSGALVQATVGNNHNHFVVGFGEVRLHGGAGYRKGERSRARLAPAEFCHFL